MDVSIVIPAHNEESRIGPTLRAYAAEYHPVWGERWELIVVLNACTDGTQRVVDEASAECPAVRWIAEDDVLGKGAAIRAGLREATGAHIAFVDADNMVAPGETRKLLDALEAHDVAVGWRRHDLALAPSSRSLPRRAVSGLSPMWSRLFLALGVHDPQCGAKALRREALDAMLPSLTENGWALDLEMLVAARRLGLSVTEAPVAWRHVPEGSKVRLTSAALEVFRATWRLRFRRDWN
ncbi:MAG: glycosyltransferase [Chloroflexota bacterium]|nr:glycosyltransferase [Chloroflexota bacterium]MDE2969318.1 glycosyltransferase [Chloroflexota bacterium]